MNNELFTDLNPTESQDINGGWGLSASASYSSSSSYSYDGSFNTSTSISTSYGKSFNTYNYTGDFSRNNIANEATVGRYNYIGLFNQ